MHDPIQRSTGLVRPLASSDAPPFHGFVECTTHALRIVHAAVGDVLPRMTRRLNDAERRALIHSGAVFVFSVAESGMKRWTDGYLWSPSRIVGNFLVYRELDSPPGKRAPNAGANPSREFTYKHDGLMKRTMTVTVGRSDLHLVCYYTQRDPLGGGLARPSSRADIMGLDMPVDVFQHTSFRVAPRTRVDGQGRRMFVEDADNLACAPRALENGHVPRAPGSSASGPADRGAWSAASSCSGDLDAAFADATAPWRSPILPCFVLDAPPHGFGDEMLWRNAR